MVTFLDGDLFSLDTYPDKELLDHMVFLVLIFQGTSIVSFISFSWFLFPFPDMYGLLCFFRIPETQNHDPIVEERLYC